MDQLITYVRGYSFGGMTYPKGGVFGPIQRPYLSLLDVSEGACELITPEGSVLVTAGHTGIAATASRFEFEYQRGSSTTARWCEGFLPAFSASGFAALNNRYDPIPTPEPLRKMLEIGIETAKESSASLNAMRNALGLAVVSSFLHHAQQNRRDGELPKIIVQARQIMQDGISDETMDMATVAETVGVTPQYLISLFRKWVGTTPARYLWKMRLRRARELLIHSIKPQSLIAFECGFKSVSHFSRSIKKQFGMTPAQLRQDRGYTRPSDEEDGVPDLHF